MHEVPQFGSIRKWKLPRGILMSPFGPDGDLLDSAGPHPAGTRRRTGRRVRRHGRTKRVRHQGRRPVHPGDDCDGRRLDRAVCLVGEGVQLSGRSAGRRLPAPPASRQDPMANVPPRPARPTMPPSPPTRRPAASCPTKDAAAPAEKATRRKDRGRKAAGRSDPGQRPRLSSCSDGSAPAGSASTGSVPTGSVLRRAVLRRRRAPAGSPPPTDK